MGKATFSVLRLYYKVATFELELRGERFLSYGCATKLPELRDYGSPKTIRGPLMLNCWGTHLVSGRGGGLAFRGRARHLIVALLARGVKEYICEARVNQHPPTNVGT